MKPALRFLLFRPCLLLALTGLLTLPTLAQTTWTGATSTDWATASNWNPAAVPTATDDVVIPSGPANQPTLSTAGAVANSVVVQSGAKLTLISGGALTINGETSSNSTGFYNAGTVDNAGTITLGNTASVGGDGLYNTGTFTNRVGGQLAIDRSTYRGLANQSNGVFTNGGKITIGANADAGEIGIESWGATFDNQAGGQIAIDRTTSSGLQNITGTFTNGGSITIGSNHSVGTNGLYSSATFTNQAGGQIAIDSSTFSGLNLNGSTFTNGGSITIGANHSVGSNGLISLATFDNQPSGQLTIDRSTFIGLNQAGTFTNQGRITIGANAPVGERGLSNGATFENKGCTALLNIAADARIANVSTIINSGTIIENASGNSNISSNTGLVQNLNGGTFTIGTDTGVLTTTAGAIWKGCTSTDWATATNWSTGAVPTASDDVVIPSGPANQPTLSTAGAVAKSVEVQSGATLTIAKTGVLTVNGNKLISIVLSYAFSNQGTVYNSGLVTMGPAILGSYGLYNTGTFTNQTGGKIEMDNAANAGLYHAGGTFTNEGTIAIGAKGYAATLGFVNGASFTNKPGGQITIDNFFTHSFINFSEFINGGSLTTGENSFNLPGEDGILNNGTLTNQVGGEITIEKGARDLLVNTNKLTNEGRIAIRASAYFYGIAAVNNQGTFENKGCSALLNVVSNTVITNTGTFTNSGQIVENASGTSSISSNSGIVVNNGGGTFDVGSGPNQPLALVSTNATQCSPPNGSIQLTGLKANQPYTLRYGLSGGTSSLLSPDSTATASGTLTIPALGGGTYALTLSGNCVSLPITLEATLTGPAPGFQGPPTVAGAPLCAGQALTVTVVGTCLGTLTAQLSDASGSFANPISLGAVAPGQNQAVIPPSTPFGTGYRLRVVSTSPNLTSEASAAFTVNALGQVSVALYPATPSRICLGDELPVTFSTTGACPFPLENVFTVQLSSSTGSFANPLTLGTANPGTTSFPLPLSLPAGTGYRVRVLTSSPATTSFASAPFELRYPSMANLTPGVGGVPQGGICRGNDVTVSFTLPAGSCAFLNGNGFIAQLSSASGSFNNPVSLGAVQAGVANSVTIPAGSAAGTGYRIRVLSSNPASTSLASLPFRVNACVSRMSAEEPELVVAPNPVSTGGEICVRVSGLDNPAFSLTTSTGRNVLISTKTDGTAEFVLTPRQALTPGLYAVTAEEGPTRITRRVLVVE